MASPTIDSGATLGANASGTNSININLTTANPDEVAVLVIGWEQGAGAVTVTGVSASGLTWTKRRGATNAGASNSGLELWYAPCRSKQAAKTITVTFSGNFDDCCIGVTAWQGCNLAAPFDPNGSVGAVSGSGSPPTVNTTTTNSDDVLIGCYGRVSNSTYSATAGWTNAINQHTPLGVLAQGTFLDYKTVSSPQTGTTYTPGATDPGCALVDALTAGTNHPGTLGIVQHSGAIHGNSVPGSSSSVVLAGAPTVGNLLIAFVGMNIAASSLTINTSKWTVLDKAFQGSDNGSISQLCLYRYVQMGDTATLDAFATAGSTYWTHTVYEISGVTGNIDTDLIYSQAIRQTEANGQIIPPVPCPVNGALALLGTASYNGGTNPSVSGAWATDETHNNNANFGSASGSHNFLESGNVIDGTITQGTSAPYSAILVILAPTQPTKGWVRHFHSVSENASPGTPVLPWKMKQGSLIVAFIGWDRGNAVNPTIGGSWTEYASQVGSTNKQLIALYYYVQVGDTFTLPQLVSSGSTFYSLSIVEIQNVTGTFATDHISDKKGHQASGTTLFNTTADTTTAADELAIEMFVNYNASSHGALPGSGWVTIGDRVDGGVYGIFQLSIQYYPSNGSTVQAGLTPTSNDHSSYIQSIFLGGAGGGGGGGGGAGASKRTFPAAVLLRTFPVDTGRTFPRA
jgi:hypothetical protein